MSAHLVPDTSVIIKWFRQGEILAEQALALRAAYLEGRIQLSVPSLLAYELAYALRYKGDLTTAQVEDAIQSLFDMALEWVPPTAAMMRRAAVIARTADATIYDATFAALAESLEATVVTADERLVRRLEGWPFVLFLGKVENNPERDHLALQARTFRTLPSCCTVPLGRSTAGRKPHS